MRRILLATKLKKRRRQTVAVFLTLSILFLQVIMPVGAEPTDTAQNQQFSSGDTKIIKNFKADWATRLWARRRLLLI